MAEFFKVSSLTYKQIMDHFSAVDIGHAIYICSEELGYMDMIEKMRIECTSSILSEKITTTVFNSAAFERI